MNICSLPFNRASCWRAFGWLSLTLVLAACGGGSGHKSNDSSAASYSSDDNSSGYSSEAMSSVEMSSMGTSSSEMSSAEMSSSLSSIAAATPPITGTATNIGGTYVATNVPVEILLSSGGSLSTSTQSMDGRTLYIFDNDAPGSSNCVNDTCITNWPPLLAPSDQFTVTPPFSIIDRGDGYYQWALRAKPLYFFAGDSAAGDINGEGVIDAWHVAVYQPLLLNEPTVNSADGDYLVASGKVSVAVAPSDPGTLEAQAQVREGFSLYTFAMDTSGVSNCTGQCAVNWPPLLADSSDQAQAPYSLIERSMGTNGTALQWAYQGMPLYFYIGDLQAGDTNGKAIANWTLARPLPIQTLASTTLGSYLGGVGLVKAAAPEGANEVTGDQARDGFALYTFDMDTAGAASNCVATCLTNWPALMAHAGAQASAPYSLIVRASGELQWALNGLPLYFFINDAAPGDTNGDGVNGLWHLARTAPVAVSNHPTKGALFIAHGALVDVNGNASSLYQDFTLYTFDQDPLGQSVCNAGCLPVWPALYAAAGAKAFGDFSLVTRSTGDVQWAYKGKPLYFYIGDSAPGDVTGEYTNWTIARP